MRKIIPLSKSYTINEINVNLSSFNYKPIEENKEINIHFNAWDENNKDYSLYIYCTFVENTVMLNKAVFDDDILDKQAIEIISKGFEGFEILFSDKIKFLNEDLKKNLNFID